jgi:hypothetical protein
MWISRTRGIKITIVALLLVVSAHYTGCDDGAMKPNDNIPAQFEYTWTLDTITPSVTQDIVILDVEARGDLAYMGSLDTENRSSLLKLEDGVWNPVPEARDLGLAGLVKDISISKTGIVLAVGGYWFEKVAVNESGSWRLVEVPSVESQIRCCYVASTGEIYIGCNQGIVAVYDTTVTWIMNFEELIGSYDQSGSIEAHSLSIREHDGTLYTIFSYRASSGAGARYLARSRIGEVMLIDSVLYPLNPSSDQRIGYGLFDIAGEVYTCGEGVYRIIDNQLTPIEGNVVGLWMSEGPYSNGFMLANSQELWCYDGENWEDITPIGFEHGNDNRIHGLAYTDSTVILGVTEGKGEVRAIRGKVGIK